MTLAADTAALRADLPAGGAVALVPTMGALHEGHASLVRLARTLADTVVVSVFVNPTQFGPGEDFDRYPRTLDHDVDVAHAAGADVIYAPAVDEVYPAGFSTMIDPGPLAVDLCGRTRPGHFAGVATVVVRLFGLVQPTLAVFGRKDLQQLTVIEGVTDDLALPVDIVGAPIVRDADGLALSSRNRYLDREDRRRALALPRALRRAAERFASRPIADDELRADALAELADVEVEYLELRRAVDLGPPDPTGATAVLVAARVGTTRLIDNVVLDPADPTAVLTEIPEVA